MWLSDNDCEARELWRCLQRGAEAWLVALDADPAPLVDFLRGVAGRGPGLANRARDVRGVGRTP